jgi:predicted alpha-1,6-mannanase (GH76 family)
LAGYLAAASGGLKGIVALERRLRRSDGASDGAKAKAPRGVAALAEPLRRLPSRPLTDLAGDGGEFALVLVRRMPDGAVTLLGDVSDDEAMLEKAARRLLD